MQSTTIKPECISEIRTQEMAWEEALQVARAKKEEVNAFFDAARPSELIFAGCTSPYHAGLVAADFWKAQTGLGARAVTSSELIMFPELYYPKSGGSPVLIALSRSGKTTETIWAAQEFERRYPGRMILIGCSNPDGPLAQMAALKLFLPESNEQTIPQTRSLGSMLICTLMMAAFRSGDQRALECLLEAPEKSSVILSQAEPIVQKLFEKRSYQNIFILGSGYLGGIAREIGLKCMEMSTSDAFSYPFLETRHGPRSLIDENSLVIGLYSHAGRRYEADLMSELTERHGATTLAVTPQADWETGQVSAAVRVNCDWPDGLIGLAYLPVGQLAAYYCAISKGQNPDFARFHAMYVEIKRFE